MTTQTIAIDTTSLALAIACLAKSQQIDPDHEILKLATVTLCQMAAEYKSIETERTANR